MHDIQLETLVPETLNAGLTELGTLISICVNAGAGIGFVLPFTAEDGAAFWSGTVLPAVKAGTRDAVVARTEGRIVGSVQLDCDTPANQPHRADVTKLIVHPDFRSRSIGRALMVEILKLADERSRSLITLDTACGHAEALYASLGFERVGVIPGYAFDPPRQRYEDTVIMYRAR